MGVLILIWFLLLTIMQICCAIKATKGKDKKYWKLLSTISLSTILSSIILLCCTYFLEKPITLLIIILPAIATISISIIIFFISVAKGGERKNKKQKGKKTKLDKKSYKRFVVKPFLIVGLTTLAICVNSYVPILISNAVSKTKIKDMANFVNEKYGTNFTISDSIYFEEEDYNCSNGWGKPPSCGNEPYISVFRKNGKEITVVDREGKISDDGQIKEINYYVAKYFSNITGVDIEFVQIREASNGNVLDETINKVLQTKFNEKITDSNVNEFIEALLLEDDIEFIFYVKDSENRAQVIKLLADKLNFLKEYENVEVIEIYVYDRNEDLIVNSIEPDLEYDYDYEQFSYFYVPNNQDYSLNLDDNEKFNTFIDYYEVKDTN